MGKMIIDYSNEIDGWVTPSQYAEEHNISVQTVYNKMEQGLIEYKAYKRGKMNGFLIKSDAYMTSINDMND